MLELADHLGQEVGPGRIVIRQKIPVTQGRHGIEAGLARQVPFTQ
jgi:hypothetical protein